MNFIKTKVSDAFLIEPIAFEDDRGYFLRAFCIDEMEKAGISTTFVQANLAGSRSRGTLRGLHYQVAPYQEAKMIRCVRGSIFDVVVDIRPESETYGLWYGATLSAENRHMLYIPSGCAHGYLSMEDDSEVYYLVSAQYSPDSERGILWNDPAFNIEWPIKQNPIMSDKDKQWPTFQPKLRNEKNQ